MSFAVEDRGNIRFAAAGTSDLDLKFGPMNVWAVKYSNWGSMIEAP